jgi:hypothetical protein
MEGTDHMTIWLLVTILLGVATIYVLMEYA